MSVQARRWVLLGCAAGLVVAAIVRAWFEIPPVSIGLWGIEVCDQGCHGVRWDDVPGAETDLYLIGYLAVAASLVTAVLLALVAFARAQAATARKATLVTAGAMAYFVLRGLALDALPSGVEIGFALPLGLAAAVCAYVALRRR